MDKNSCILIVGHDDIIERSLAQHFSKEQFSNVYTTTALAFNTSIQASVLAFFQEKRPEYIFLGSVRSGGIAANQKYAADFIYENLASQNNIVLAAAQFGIKRLLYFASSCVYPKEAPQPMQEDMILTGPIEATSAYYATAKIAGLKLVEGYRKQYDLPAVCAIPATVYGPGSDTDIENAHVLGALIARFTQAKKDQAQTVTLWGTGQARREFMYSSDFVEASLFLMNRPDAEGMFNMGTASDVTIQELAEMIAVETGYTGKIQFDTDKPDGAMQKLLNSQNINNLGWQAKVGLKDGLSKTIQWFTEQGV